MAYDDPHAADPDEGVDDLPEYGGGDLIVDHKAEERSREHCGDAGSDERKISDRKAPHDQTDHEDNKIIDKKECLDRSQVFLFIFGGGQQVQRCCRPAGGEEAVADPADHAEDRA